MTAESNLAGRTATWQVTRRELVQAGAAMTTVTMAGLADSQESAGGAAFTAPAPAGEAAMVDSAPNMVEIHLQVNGRPVTVKVDTRTTVLDVLRESLALKGSKKGCDHGQCGACTVLIEGRRINACLTLAVMHDGQDITTIEGLAQGEQLHPMQAAFLKHDGFQCGYCTPGQICSSVGMLNEVRMGMPSHVTADLTSPPGPLLSAEEIRERMSGNLCRCSAYPNIVAAISEVAGARS